MARDPEGESFCYRSMHPVPPGGAARSGLSEKAHREGRRGGVDRLFLPVKRRSILRSKDGHFAVRPRLETRGMAAKKSPRPRREGRGGSSSRGLSIMITGFHDPGAGSAGASAAAFLGRSIYNSTRYLQTWPDIEAPRPTLNACQQGRGGRPGLPNPSAIVSRCRVLLLRSRGNLIAMKGTNWGSRRPIARNYRY
jgi:hypothetical protein